MLQWWLKSENAYSLLELLVAMALSGIVLLGLFLGYEEYQNSIKLSRVVYHQQNDQELLKSWLSSRIRNAGFRDVEAGIGPHKGCVVEVTPTSLTLVSDETGQRVRLVVEQGLDSSAPVFRKRIDYWQNVSSSWMIGKFQTFIKGVSSLGFSWVGNSCDPTLVKVAVTFTSPDEISNVSLRQNISSNYVPAQNQTYNSKHKLSLLEFLVVPRNVIYQ